MNRTLLIVGLLAGLSACNRPHNAAEATANPDAVPAAATTADPATGMKTKATAAPDFVQQAGVSDLFEVATSRSALKRSSNPQVKSFAQMMIKDHTASTQALKKAVKASGQNLMLPAALPDDKTAKLNDLRQVAAADFDKAYMDAQIAGHQAALDLMTRYANNGTVDQLKAFASATGATVAKHLDTAKTISGALK